MIGSGRQQPNRKEQMAFSKRHRGVSDRLFHPCRTDASAGLVRSGVKHHRVRGRIRLLGHYRVRHSAAVVVKEDGTMNRKNLMWALEHVPDIVTAGVAILILIWVMS
jgi:hypothetical protein